jgi:hypothetical protein
MTIEKERWYSLAEIIILKLLPMAKSRYLARRWIKEGKIKAISDGFGKGRRVRVKGQWLLDFIAACEKGKF